MREWQWKHRNNPGGSKFNYAVIDGSPVPPSLVEYIDVAPDAKKIALMTDGYPTQTLSHSLQETNQNYQNMMLAGEEVIIDDITAVFLER